MSFYDTLREIHFKAKPSMNQAKNEFERSQKEFAERFIYEQVFPAIANEYRKTPWIKHFEICIIFSDGIWKVMNGLNLITESKEYMFDIAPYIQEVVKKEKIKSEAYYDDKETKDEYCICLNFKIS